MLLDLASQLASLASALAAPLAALTSALAAPFAALTSALAAPLAALASALATPLASLAAALAAAVMIVSAKRASADSPEPDLETLERAVEDDDPEAEYQLSMIFKEGVLTERDLESSTTLLLRAASQHHLGAMLELSHRYRDGEGLPRDLALATRWMALAETEAEAETDDDDDDEDGSGATSSGPDRLSPIEFEKLMVSAGVDVEELARRFVEASETGRPVDFDDVLTREQFKVMRERFIEARASDDPDALRDFRRRSRKPGPTPPPALQGPGGIIELERRLRLEGYDELQIRLALASALMYGQGVEVDIDEAFKQLRLAAELGSVPASLSVGAMLLSGTGTLSDLEAATPLLRRGLALGLPQAPFHLWQISYRRPDLVSPDEGLDFLKRAADMGYPPAMTALAVGPPSGVESIVAAAEDEYPGGLFLLAEHYRQGPPEDRDLEKALDLYKRAAEKGYPEAARTLERIHRIGAGVPASESEADEWRLIAERLEAEKTERGEAVKGAAGGPAKKPAKKSPKKSAKKHPQKPKKKPNKPSGKKPSGK